jgi:hypothetical protein
MPDNFCIQVPDASKSQAFNKNKEKKDKNNYLKTENDDEVIVNNSVSPRNNDRIGGIADSLLSKHNGWITIDQENADRK